jgi:acetylornithine deacetylase
LIDADAVLSLHRELIEIPSLSHEEGPIADFVQARLARSGAKVIRLGDNVIAHGSKPPRLLFNSHLDTVPPTSAWTRPPHQVTTEDGKVFGLGSNDTKGSVAAMITAFEILFAAGHQDVAIMLVPEEETGGKGTELAWPHVRDELGWWPEAILVGEPTEMQIGASQSGMLVLELVAKGVASHAANATSNPIFDLAADLLRVKELGGQPTVLNGATARNQVPAEAKAVIDFRTRPGTSHDALIERLETELSSEVGVRSRRLGPFACPDGSPLIAAIQRALPSAKPFHSNTMSDLVFFQGCHAVKIGPGLSARSHTSDEFIFADEVVAGVVGYLAIAKEVLA